MCMNWVRGTICLALMVCAGCTDSLGPQKTLQLGVIDYNGTGPDLVIPTEVWRGVAEFSITTYGNSCVDAGDIQVEWAGSSLTLRPMDWDYPPGVNSPTPCLDLLKIMTRRVIVPLQVSAPGSVAVTVEGVRIPQRDTIRVRETLAVR